MSEHETLKRKLEEIHSESKIALDSKDDSSIEPQKGELTVKMSDVIVDTSNDGENANGKQANDKAKNGDQMKIDVVDEAKNGNMSTDQCEIVLDDDPVEPEAKKSKKETLYDNGELSLSMITLKQVIDIRFFEKSVILEGEYNGDRVLIFIEKLPFDEKTIEKLFLERFEMTKIIQNDIYGSYSSNPKIENKLKTTIICPATDRHFEKYIRSQYVMIVETPALYESITLPYLEENKFSIDWVYNILDHKQESERIVCEDEDDKNGFILLPDLKWDAKDAKKLYLVAIIKRRGIKSIRDLTDEHLSLLKNIKEKGCQAIKAKYDVDADKLQIYFHYQPSYYHLHIHFNTIQFEHPRLYIGSSHLLDTVITNIEIDSNYYKKATLPFRLKCSKKLNDYYKTKLTESIKQSIYDQTSNDEDDVILVE